MGVISTLNAGAEQIPTPPAAVSDPADAVAEVVDTDDFVPPATLPWGAKPQRLKIGRAGASSKALAAAGADAALPEPGDELVVEPEFEPKGDARRGPKNGVPKLAPPAPRSIGVTTDLAVAKPNYFYGGAYQFAESGGSYANLVISKPTVAREDYHSLGEIAVQSVDGRQTVEVGWTVNRAMHGDDEPHLFVYHWVDKQPSCYNSCGFVPYSKTVVPGMTLPQGVSKRFGIQYFKDGDGNGAWWIAYDSEWVGFFPDTLWGGRYTRSGLVQWYGEVATERGAPCGTWMGNGEDGESPAAARIGTISLIEGPAVNIVVDDKPQNPFYTVVKASERTMRYGGKAIGKAGC
jgi:hypothetical protein